MDWSNIKITIFKELRGIVRDKKSFHKLLLLPLLIPFIIFLFGFLSDFMENSNYDVGINYTLSKEEKEILKKYDNIDFKVYKDDKELKEAYDNGEISGYIIKNDINYIIYTDQSLNSGAMIDYYASTYLEEYSRLKANQYLVDNNIDPNLVFNSITYSSESLAEEETDSMFIVLLSLPITYVLMIVVMACVTVATDATSGEKERGTLETILTFPVNSSDLVTGKYLATAILGLAIGLFSYLLTLPSIYVCSYIFESFKDLTITINFKIIFLALIVIVISTLLSAGVCIALSGKAKTYKEAQSSLQFVSFLPMIPYFVKIMEVDNKIFNLVPIANCGMALNDITMNKFDMNSLIIIFISTIFYIVLILIYISKQYKSEKTLFG
ncbi:MAG: ABC transporter permease [Bacilli bacterium]|nr:ABC transporter permease [Bacilli bacterium]